MSDLTRLSAAELVALYRGKTLSPVEVARATLERIAAVDPALNAYCLVDPERALASAAESEARWMRGAPLGLVDGVPTAVKDVAPAKGWPTWRGSFIAASEAPAAEDSAPVARLREHGAVFLGKTTLPEFAWKGVTDSPRFGVTRNPWNPSRTPGGSSGGAGAAVAANLCALATGTDGSGSVRIPAAFCGIFGMKPTYGVVPQFPLPSHLGDIIHTGPMTRTVEDGALMLAVMAKADSRDWTATGATEDYTRGLDEGVAGLRIAYSATLGDAEVDPQVAEVVNRAVRVFEDLGAIIEEAEPGFDDPRDLIDTIYMAGNARVVFQLSEADRARMDQGLVAFAARGLSLSATDYVAAKIKRDALGTLMARFHDRYDLLITPQLGLTAFAAGRDFPDGRGYTHWFDWAPLAYPFNLTGQPAATVPCGVAADGLPVALQIVGRRFADALVLRASRAFERAHPFAAAPDVCGEI
jgi:aspartyl-tRNA(Asn)/glutamyl-tRNA(Gln) amidotransferase subunit A